MSREQRQILEMLKDGKVSVDEAERLLSALDETPARSTAAASAAGRLPARATGRKPKFLRVAVADGDRKVDVRVPLGLIRAGMKLQALIPEEVRGKVTEELAGKGIDLDLKRMKPEDVEALVENLADLTVDVGEGDEKTVRVYCE